MFNQCVVQRDPFSCVFPDPKITSSIDVAEKKSARFGDNFFVVALDDRISVVTEYELNCRRAAIQRIIYSTANGFQFA